MKKASSDDEKSFKPWSRKLWTTNEKLQPAVTKATTGIEKSFKLIVLAVNPAMVMMSFCCNHSWFCYKRRWNLLQPFSQLLAAAPPSSHARPWPSSPRCRFGRKKVQRLQLRAWSVAAQTWSGPTRQAELQWRGSEQI